jgi:hypothetical protein
VGRAADFGEAILPYCRQTTTIQDGFTEISTPSCSTGVLAQ